jgi:hypothetical protein
MTASLLVLLVGVAYLVIGVVFARLPAATHQTLVLWRLAAWAVSAVVYGVHIAYLRLRVGRSTLVTAWQAALAAALGAFGLAVVGPARAALVGGHQGSLWILALLLWPLITGVPAFLVAYVTATVFARVARR